MCKYNSPTDSSTYLLVETTRKRTNDSFETFERLGQDPDPENLLVISTRKQRHMRDECLVKQIFVENIVKKLKMEVNRKYVCDFSFQLCNFHLSDVVK